MDEERQRLLAEVSQLKQAMMLSSSHQWQGDRMALNLTIGQLRVLFVLFGQTPMPMSALAQLLGIALPSCTNIVNRLVRAGMVERQEDSSDRRLVLCTLSERGNTLVTKLRQAGEVMSEALMRHLTTDELRIVAQAMAIFGRAASAMREEQTAQ